MKSLREAADNARIARCRPINEDPEPRMRHCESCEVPVGIMSLGAFEALSICPKCDKAIHRELKEPEKTENWITVEEAEILYKVSRSTLYDLVNSGELTSRPAWRGRVILESALAKMRVKRPSAGERR